MTTPFQASKLFENSKSADGWDDWDWVDNTNPAKQSQTQSDHMQTSNFPAPPPPLPMEPMDLNQQIGHRTFPQLTESNTAIDNNINSNGHYPTTNNNSNNNNNLNSAGSLQEQHHESCPSVPHQQTYFMNDNNYMDPNKNHVTQWRAAEQLPAHPTPAPVENHQYHEQSPHIPIRTQFYDNFHSVETAQLSNVENRQIEPNMLQSHEPANHNVTENQNSILNYANNLPPVLAPPSLDQSPFANTNPFKRVGTHSHRTPPPPPATNASQAILPVPTQRPPSVEHTRPLSTAVCTPPPFYQNNSFSNQYGGTHSDSSSLDTFSNSRNYQNDNFDVASHNDRNEYLQTGHLSEEGVVRDPLPHNIPSYAGRTVLQAESNDANSDHLPPPGLSRLVLGEPETTSQPNQSSQPPIGLDRMIPGTELSHNSHLNLERQADGQDTSVSTSISSRNTHLYSASVPLPSESTLSLPSHNVENQVYIPTGSEAGGSNRNLYLVAGENNSDNATNIQRVVTGVENVSNQEIPIIEQQRELEMDGENLDDNYQSQSNRNTNLQPPSLREEPIEGGNTQDEVMSTNPPPPHTHAITATNLNQTQTDSIEDLDVTNHGQKYNSNPSTGNDESDKEKSYYNRKGSNGRRNDERTKKRDDKRYETEDTDHSVRDRRRHKDGRHEKHDKTDGGYDKERDYRGRSSEKLDTGNRSYRDRPSGRDKHYRDSSRDDEERYEGGSRYRENSGNRYETDGSRYETEDARYERTNRRRAERDYGRYREEKPDRNYGKNRDPRDDRDARYPDERYHNRDDRYLEYENANKSRGSGQTKRDRKPRDRGTGSERGDNYSSSGYYPHSSHQPYGYDPYSSYYQQQQYYENLRRTNPHAYAEWYNRYFGGQQMQIAAAAAAAAAERGRESGRESVHSGRSSSRDNERFILSTSHSFYNPYNNMSHHHLHHKQFSVQHNSTMLDTNQQMPFTISTSGSRPSSSFSQNKLSRGQPLDSLDHGQNIVQPERLTPFKYTANHCTASFENGLLVCVKQKYLPNNEIVNNVNLSKFAQNNSTRRLYQLFPGPLTPATHTKQVIDFCLEQIRTGPGGIGGSRSTSNSLSSLQSIDQSNRASFSLLWNLLILLLRQRGIFVGSDISELLLKNKEEYPYEQQLNSTKYSQRDSDHSSEAESKEESAETDSNENEQSTALSESEITEKFRNYLLYGSITEALDWATDHNLWGHALFLASKMDRRSHANVMIKFANKLNLTDPLQTLYQLKSGRIPLSVTCTQDEKWGDWRPHLAMIISNASQKPEIDRKAIITLGDSLHNRGDLFAAQFCYLMAKVEFSKYSDVKPDTSIILNNTANAVRLILLGASCHKTFNEFATDEAIIMTEIYEYACSLSTDNFSIIEFQPYKYLLGTRMLDYGFHLKSLMYMEQVGQHIQKNTSQYDRKFVEKVYVLADKLKYYDPVLEKTLDNINDDDGGQTSNTNQQQWQQDLFNLLEQYPAFNYSSTTQSISNDSYQQSDVAVPSQIDKEFVQLNQQFMDLNSQYQAPIQQNDYTTNYNREFAPPTAEFHSLPQNNAEKEITENCNQQMQHSYADQHQQQHQYHSNVYQPPLNDLQYGGYSEQPQIYQPQSIDESSPYATNSYSNPEAPKPTISMPNSFSNKPGFYEEPSTDRESDKKSAQENNILKKSNALNSATESSKSGWIGGFFNKLSLKPKNQMILPDDKNPSIVWDPEKKKWMNTEQDESEGGEIFKPPPKMSDFAALAAIGGVSNNNFGQIPNIPAASTSPINHNVGITNNPYGNPMLNDIQPNNNEQTAKIPTLQSNMFKMQRNKTLKKSYVDVFNPSGAAPKNDAPILAPSMPLMPTQANFFVPNAMPTTTNDSTNGETMFYNPNQLGGYQQ